MADNKPKLYCLMSKIRSIDLFGPRVQLRLNNKKEYKTTLGGCFTVILFLATAFVAFSNITQLVLRTNPTMQFKEELWQNGNYLLNNSELFTKIFAIVNKNNKQFLSGFKASLSIVQSGGQSLLFQLELCTNNAIEFAEIRKEDPNINQSYNQFMCLSDQDFQQVSQLKIDYSTRIQYNIELPYDTLSLSDSLEVIIIGRDHFIDGTSFSNPFQIYNRIDNIALQSSFLDVQANISLTLSNIISHNGYLLGEIYTDARLFEDSFVVSETNSADRMSSSTDKGHSITLNLLFNRKKATHSRTYIQLLDVLSVIGGFIKSQMVCYRFFTKPFTKLALYISLLNELFSFEDDSEKNELANSKPKDLYETKEELEQNLKLTKILNEHIQNDRYGVSQDVDLNKEAEKTFRKFMRIGQETLFLKPFDYIKSLLNCWRRSSKGKFIKLTKKKVNERIDIVYILQKLVEIDKLKMILLNEQQRRVFDYLPKPVVDLDKKKPMSLLKLRKAQQQSMRTEWSLLNSEQSSLQKAILAVQAFQQIMQNDSNPLSLIDLKLIEMLDPEIVKKFLSIKLDTIQDFITQKATNPAASVYSLFDIESQNSGNMHGREASEGGGAEVGELQRQLVKSIHKRGEDLGNYEMQGIYFSKENDQNYQNESDYHRNIWIQSSSPKLKQPKSTEYQQHQQQFQLFQEQHTSQQSSNLPRLSLLDQLEVEQSQYFQNGVTPLYLRKISSMRGSKPERESTVFGLNKIKLLSQYLISRESNRSFLQTELEKFLVQQQKEVESLSRSAMITASEQNNKISVNKKDGLQKLPTQRQRLLTAVQENPEDKGKESCSKGFVEPYEMLQNPTLEEIHKPSTFCDIKPQNDLETNDLQETIKPSQENHMKQKIINEEDLIKSPEQKQNTLTYTESKLSNEKFIQLTSYPSIELINSSQMIATERSEVLLLNPTLTNTQDQNWRFQKLSPK